jgi:hypothetical protein
LAKKHRAPKAEEPAESPLLELIEKFQEEAYGPLDIQLRDYMDYDVSRKRVSHFTEQILATHYFDQSDKEKRLVRSLLTKGLLIKERRSPTKYQNERYFRHLEYYQNVISARIPESLLARVSKPIIATLPSPQLNAFSAKLPGGADHAVIFNEALLTFLFLLAKILAVFFPVRADWSSALGKNRRTVVYFDRDAIRQELLSTGAHLQMFINLVGGLIYKGNPLADTKPDLVQREANYIAAHLIFYGELFVFAHELAHEAHGDHEDAPLTEIPGVDIGCRQLNISAARELAADAGALRCLIETNGSLHGELAHAYWGAEMFLKAVELSEKAVTLAKFGYEARVLSDTHPCTGTRRQSLRDALKTHVPSKHAVLDCHVWELAAAYADAINDILDALWKDASQMILDLHRQGAPVSPKWEWLKEDQVTAN